MSLFNEKLMLYRCVFMHFIILENTFHVDFDKAYSENGILGY